MAATGDVDPAFGDGGLVITDMGSYNNRAYAIALQPGLHRNYGYRRGGLANAESQHSRPPQPPFVGVRGRTPTT